MSASRREFCVALPALFALLQGDVPQPVTLPSANFDLETLPSRRIKTVVSRAMFAGKLHEGIEVSLHESDLDPDSAPHAPHSHRHEEMVFVMEGILEFTLHGVPSRCGPGSVLFAGSHEEHGIRNPTREHTKYWVLALGPAND